MEGIFRLTKKGSIFVYTLWVVIILTVFGVYLGRVAKINIEFSKRLQARMHLSYISDSSILSAINIIMGEDAKSHEYLAYRLLREDTQSNGENNQKTSDISSNLSYNYITRISGGVGYCQITDEQAKLNINRASFESLKGLVFITAGVGEDDAGILANAIIDWRDPDNERPGLNVWNNEDWEYKAADMPYTPKNSYYELIEELLLVKGMTPEIYSAIRPYITVYGNSRVNINTCEGVILRLLGLNKSLADKIMAFRKGKFKALENKDKIFKAVSTIVKQLDDVIKLSDGEKKAIELLINENRLGVDSDFFRVTTRSEYFSEICYIDCVVKRDGRIEYWVQKFKDS